jgi:dTDP-4-dehydrorhamnose reductase
MKVLLIGAGKLATNWCMSTNAEVYNVIVNRSVLGNLPAHQIVVTDLVNFSELVKIIKLIKPDVIINTAAITSIEYCETHKNESKVVNSDLPKILAEISSILKIKFIHISTDHFESIPSQKRDELVNPVPVNQYGRTKVVADEFVKNFDTSIVIRTNFFGWSASSRQNSFKNLYSDLTQKQSYTGFDDITYTPISVTKLIETITYLIKIDFKGLINISGTENISKYTFASTFAEMLNINNPNLVRGRYDSIGSNIVRPRTMGLDNSKLFGLVSNDGFDLRSNLKLVIKQLSDGFATKIGSIH